MGERRRILVLILIMAVVVVAVGGSAIGILYNVAFEEERKRLIETVQSQARLIEAMARFDSQFSQQAHPEGAAAATISQTADAHERYAGIGDTGEFTLARREGDQIVFILRQRHQGRDKPRPVPFDVEVAEPMRRALSGQSGTVIGPDYRGVTVLAAHEPVSELDLGIVAKIDITEIRAPFIKAGGIVTAIAVVIVGTGTALFFCVSNPMIRKIEESEKQHRDLYENAPVAYWSVSASDGSILQANHATTRLLGYDRETLLRMKVFDLYADTPQGLDKAKGVFERFRRGERIEDVELQMVNEDGVTVWVSVSVHPVRDADGKVTASRSAAVDITERKRAEQTLLESEERYRTSVDTMLDCFGIYSSVRDRSGRIVDFRVRYVNEAACVNNRMDKDEQIGKLICEILPSHRETGLFDKYCQVVETGNPLQEDALFFEDVYNKKTLSRVFNIRVVKLGDGFACAWQDITERKRTEMRTNELQRELAHVSRLSTMGEMAAGLAHELNQPLTTITNYAKGTLRLLRSGEDDSGEHLEIMELIAEQALWAGDIIHRIRGYIDHEEFEKSLVDVNLAIREVLTLLTGEIHLGGVSVELDLPDSLPGALADSIQIQQVILNLARNATEAMAGQEVGPRKLTIRSSRVDKDYIKIAVVDTGPGVSAEILEDMFAPFFTTKADGLGMGLAISRSIVDSHGGRLWVTSEAGKGTAFHFILPVIVGGKDAAA